MATDIPGFPANKLDFKVTLFNGSALLAHIITPTTNLINGMVWTTSAGLFARINGATVGPYITTAPAPTGWTPSLNTASPNNTINASRMLASGGTTNQDAVLQAKGTGAVQAQLADGTATGGNKRGASATDWQAARSVADEVAGAIGSAISGGRENKITATADYSVISGGRYNVATNGSYGAIGGGYFNNLGGSSYETIAGGGTNTASGVGAAVGGGYGNTADADYAWIGGGLFGQTRGIKAAAVYADASSLSVGAKQHMGLVVGCETTNATTTVCTSDNAAASTDNQLILPDNAVYVVKGLAAGREQATGDTITWEFTAAIRRGAGVGTTAMLAACTPVIIGNTAGAATWALLVDADTTNGGLRIRATGQAAKTIRWAAHLKSLQVVG